MNKNRACRHHRRRGLTIVLAMVLIAMVGVTLAALGTLLVTQVRRTQMAQTQAQLRQLLQIGGQSALEALNQSKPEIPSTIPLPASLAGAKVTITPSPAQGTQRTVKVVAALQNQSAVQTLTLAAANNHWQIVHAILDH